MLDVLDATATAHPGAPAVDTGTDVLTYRALCAEVARRAARLSRAGAGPSDRIGIRIPSGTTEMYLSLLAVLRCGAAYVPVDADDPAERAATVFREAGVCLVVGPDGSLTEGPASAMGDLPRAPLPDDDAWVIFTSGSTGAPKGVAVTHRSAAAFVDAEAQLFLRERPLGPGDRVLAGLSVAFDASCEEMWLAWRHGACLVPAPRSLVRSGHELGPWLAEHAITVVSTVPTLAALWPPECLAGVRLLIVGGEACPAGLVERFAVPGREMWNTYGPTETTVVACAARLLPGRPVRIGLPLHGWDLAVVDRADEPVPAGAEGELVIAGVGAAHYLDPVKDSDRFRPSTALGTRRAYHTGDLVRADPEGLVFAGRADEQVKIGGLRVELGEIDAALSALPGVRGAAAAVRTTAAGDPLLVGYVVPGRSYPRRRARALLGERLPAALVPVLVEVDGLPTRASGKADRDALPWPPRPSPAPADGPRGTAAALAGVWEELLGVRPAEDDDFTALGGTSLTAARMASALREHHPGVSVAGLYRHPVLRDMAAHLDSLAPPASRHPAATPAVPPVPRRTGVAQLLVLGVLYGIAGLRTVVAVATVSNVLTALSPTPWAPHTSWWLLLAGWILLFSAPARLAVGAAAARLLTRGIGAGAYPRGGRVHLRLWAAERAVASFGVPAVLGTPWAPWYARALGCAVGEDVELHTLPPVTGLAELGDGCAVELEADIAGHWLDGATLRVGPVRVGAGARVGHRAVLMPGASLGPGAQLAPGACLDTAAPAGTHWEGSPARQAPRADGDRRTGSAPAQQGPGTPAPAGTTPEGSRARGAPRAGGDRAAGPGPPPQETARAGRDHRRWWAAVYGLSLIGLPMLGVLVAAPSLVAAYFLVQGEPRLSSAGLSLLMAVPGLTVVTVVCQVLVVAAVVRAAGRGLRPGSHPARGGVAWRAWLVTRLVGGARGSLFPLYCSLATPPWLRLLGARIGRRGEISTVLPLPSLLTVEDGAFLADDTLVAPYELRGSRLVLGPARIGRRAFVGNSGIVAAGRTVADRALVGVLSDAPEHGAPGTSWLGRPPLPLPRTPAHPDPGRTFEPPARLVAARTAVETCRLVPLMCFAALVVAVTVGELAALGRGGPVLAALVAGPLLAAAGVVAALTATAAKWLLMGRFRPGEHLLWSAFVWRNELYDTFVESLAVPWLIGPCTGTPVLNWWLRSLGTRVGRGVWCDTHWLPENDLVTLGEGAGVGRGCVLQTHLFHDRIMRMDTVRLADGACLGPHGILLPGTAVGEHTAIAPASLVMRGESVPARTRWAGNPIAGRTGDKEEGA
ncbi:Pls/PosA family non-ribosomal peptide synthetase [Streptomyces sp. NPDC046261]|uniref:Pls/PosA family non-ribosomal peptide synthetase n=1 Tax=Streptomyces sp. NPDC046261 TaxID=3157200 RepID=UPI0034075F44